MGIDPANLDNFAPPPPPIRKEGIQSERKGVIRTRRRLRCSCGSVSSQSLILDRAKSIQEVSSRRTIHNKTVRCDAFQIHDCKLQRKNYETRSLVFPVKSKGKILLIYVAPNKTQASVQRALLPVTCECQATAQCAQLKKPSN